MPEPLPKPAASMRADIALFAVVFVAYTLRLVAASPSALIWDEARYLDCAAELSKGHLASENNTDFVNGPGYPLVLLPFVASGLPLFLPRLLNGVFVALAAVLLRRTIKDYAGTRWAAATAFIVTLHPNLFRLGPYLMTEPLTILCVCAFLFAFTRALREPCRSWRWIATAAFAFFYLIMTRVIFGHVVLVTLAGSLAAMVVCESIRTALARTALIAGLAFALCIPYLAYTRAHTGQNLCWSTNGGELLYWATSHYAGENGHWFSYDDAISLPELAPNHKTFIERVNKLSVPEREAEFAKAAKENIASAPDAVLYNWLCNVSRLFFGFPRSFQTEDIVTLAVIAFNAPLLLLMGAAFVLGVFRMKSLPPEITILFCIAAIYLGGSSIASALPRYFLVITPVLWLFTAATLSRNVMIRLRP